MTHKVLIYLDTNDPRSGIDQRFRNVYREWCEEICLEPYYISGMYTIRNLKMLAELTFTFESLDDAILFKLSWGGQ